MGKRIHADRNCLCCGKTWYRHSISRKKPKCGSSKLHNAFCSKRCAKKHMSWECNRRARCEGCGKATGDFRTANCEACRARLSRVTRDSMGPWADALSRGMSAIRSRQWERGRSDEWERRIQGALTSLRKRARTSVGRPLKRKVASSWEECIANACGATWTYRDEWDRKACNAARNIRGKKRNAEAGVARAVHRAGIQVRFNW